MSQGAAAHGPASGVLVGRPGWQGVAVRRVGGRAAIRAALIAIVTACYVVLYFWERRSAHPVIPVRLLQRPEIARPNAVVICFAAALFASVLYLPLYLQIGHGLGISASGTLLLPITLSMVTAATFTGRLVSRTGKVTIFPMIGLTLATSALIALGVTITFASITLVLFLTGITGVGLGMVMPPMQVAVQQAAGRESLGAAIDRCRCAAR